MSYSDTAPFSNRETANVGNDRVSGTELINV